MGDNPETARVQALEKEFYGAFVASGKDLDLEEVEAWVAAHAGDVGLARYDDQPHHSNSLAVFFRIPDFGTAVHLLDQCGGGRFELFLYAGQAETWLPELAKAAGNLTPLSRALRERAEGQEPR